MVIVVEYESSIFYDDAESRSWFEDEVVSPDTLVLHSNELGDSIGKVISVTHADDPEVM